MISQLTGKVAYESENFIVLDVNGVGYKVFVTNDTIMFLVKNDRVTIWTYLAVREQSLDLYGFLTKDDLDFFELLISVSGIGPKSAIAILNATTSGTLKSAIASGDVSYLTRMPGVGKKGAEKIILELKDKVGDVEGGTAEFREDVDVIEALKSLGYSAKQASDALKSLDKKVEGTRDKVREALKILSSK